MTHIVQKARGQMLVQQGDASRGLPACLQCHGERLTGVQPNVPGLLRAHETGLASTPLQVNRIRAETTQ